MAKRRFDEEQNEQVGSRIKSIRELLGMDQSEFAAHLQERGGLAISQASISRKENGHEEIGLDDVRAVAKVDPWERGLTALVTGDGFDRIPQVEEPPATDGASVRKERLEGTDRRRVETSGGTPQKRAAGAGTPVVPIASRGRPASRGAKRRGKDPH